MSEETNINEYTLQGELIVLTRKTVEVLLSEDKGSEAVALYIFYINTALRQSKQVGRDINQPYATDKFVRKGLNWGSTKLTRAKKVLKKYNLVDFIKKRDEEGKILGHYVRIKYLFSRSKRENLASQKEFIQNTHNPGVDESTSGKQKTNTDGKDIGNTDGKDIGNTESGPSKKTPKKKTISYLDNIDEETVQDLKEKFRLPEETIRTEAEKCADYIRENEDYPKNYAAKFRNWLRNHIAWNDPKLVEEVEFENNFPGADMYRRKK